MAVFRNVHDGNKNTIHLPAEVDSALGDKFAVEFQSWMLLPVTDHILDFRDVRLMDRSIYPKVAGFLKMLKQSGKRITSINLREKVFRQIIDDGMRDLFNPVSPKAPNGKIDVEFINPFLEAVKLVLKTQASTEVKPGKPFVGTQNGTLDFGLVAIIALNCHIFRGNIALSFPSKVFLSIYERMLGEKHETITSEIEDGVGELLNIIYGTAKTTLNRDQGLDLKPALPTVLTGEKIKVRQPPESHVLVLPFTADIGEFHVEIARILATDSQKRSA